MSWETIIGLEVHCQLNTQSKIFSGAATAYGAMPNTQACAIDLGMPGVLPVLNADVVKKAIQFGLAVSATINQHSVFARKNYFYPDLPKGYQISQYELPIVEHGHLMINLGESNEQRIGITRAHLEEDAGKSLHEDFQGMSGIDLNRAGTPLIEIVSEPDLRNAEDAVAYLKALHALVCYLDICDGNMQEGSFRCDANVSVRRPGEPFGTRTETKNINSFRFVEQAINYEVERQIDILEQGGNIQQETRLFDADKHVTKTMRTKEDAHDYRYFPDPDLLPLKIEQTTIDALARTLPELPQAKQQRFTTQYQLSLADAGVLTANKALADYYEELVKQAQCSPKLAHNWVMGDLSALLNKDEISITECSISAQRLAGLLQRIEDNTISGKIAKTVFEFMCQSEDTADSIIEQQGLKQVTDSSAIEAVIDEVMQANPKQLADYRAGKDKLFMFFVGQVMKATRGKANPEQVNALLKDKLS